MRSWQRDLQMAEVLLRGRYYGALMSQAHLSESLARYHAEHATVETMKIYLGEK
jgi:hypothetical protein